MSQATSFAKESSADIPIFWTNYLKNLKSLKENFYEPLSNILYEKFHLVHFIWKPFAFEASLRVQPYKIEENTRRVSVLETCLYRHPAGVGARVWHKFFLEADNANGFLFISQLQMELMAQMGIHGTGTGCGNFLRHGRHGSVSLVCQASVESLCGFLENRFIWKWEVL